MIVVFCEMLICCFKAVCRLGAVSRLNSRCGSKGVLLHSGLVSVLSDQRSSNVAFQVRAARFGLRIRLSSAAVDNVRDHRLNESVSTASNSTRGVSDKARINRAAVSTGREVQRRFTARRSPRLNGSPRCSCLGPFRLNFRGATLWRAFGRMTLAHVPLSYWRRPSRFRSRSNWDAPDPLISVRHSSQLHASTGTSTVPLFVLEQIKFETAERRSYRKKTETCHEKRKTVPSASQRLRGSNPLKKFRTIQLRRNGPTVRAAMKIATAARQQLTRLTF